MTVITTDLAKRTAMYWRMAQALRNPGTIEKNKVAAVFALEGMKSLQLTPRLLNRVTEVTAMAKKNAA